MEGEMLGALLDTVVSMEGEMMGALLVANVHGKFFIRWKSHESY